MSFDTTLASGWPKIATHTFCTRFNAYLSQNFGWFMETFFLHSVLYECKINILAYQLNMRFDEIFIFYYVNV